MAETGMERAVSEVTPGASTLDRSLSRTQSASCPPDAPSGSGALQTSRQQSSDETSSISTLMSSDFMSGSARSIDPLALGGSGLHSLDSAEVAENSAYFLVLELVKETASELESPDSELVSPEVVDLDDAAYVADPEACKSIREPVVFCARGGAPGAEHCFFLDNCTDEELTCVRMVVPDVQGILSASTQAFEAQGLDIIHCQMEQMERLSQGWAYIECLVSTDEGDQVNEFLAAKNLCEEMRQRLGERLASAKRRSYQHHRTRRGNSKVGERKYRQDRWLGSASSGQSKQKASEAGEHIAGGEPPPNTSMTEIPLARRALSGAIKQQLEEGLAEANVYDPLGNFDVPSSSSISSGSHPGSFELQAPAPAAVPAVALLAEPAGGLEASAAGAEPAVVIPSVASMMMPPPKTVGCQASVEEAIAALDEKPGRTSLLVDNGPGLELGLVTWSDLMAALDTSARVGEIQSCPIVTVFPSDLVTMAAELMEKFTVNRLMVKEDARADSSDPSRQIVGEVRMKALGTALTRAALPQEAQAPAVELSAASGMSRLAEAALSAWEIPYAEVEKVARIGQGSYGEVWHGRWRGTDVAVKRVWGLHESIEETAKAAADFEREITLLSRLRHPNVVMFMGACSLAPDVALVMEYCPRGTLHRVLHRSSVELPLSLRVRMAVHVARGMLALHSSQPRIIHRDLKTANLLVGASFEVKVCDFGLSRTMENATNCMSNRSQGSFGTVEYAAPEVLRGEPYSEKCDVWSFGVVLWELITRCRPYAEVAHSVSIIAGVSLGKLSLSPIPDSPGSAALQSIIDQCCLHNPASRPSFSELLLKLEQEANALKRAAPRRQRPDHVIMQQATAAAALMRLDSRSDGTSPGSTQQTDALMKPQALDRAPSLVSPFLTHSEESSAAPVLSGAGDPASSKPIADQPVLASLQTATSIESPFAQMMLDKK